MQITKLLTDLVWYGPTTTLSNVAWRTSIKGVRAINPAGTGFISYDPAQTLNSLTSIATGQIIQVSALAAAIQGGGFVLDNGVPPTSTGTGAVRLVATFPANQTSAVPLPVLFADEPGTYALDGGNPAVGVTGLAYAKAGVAVNLPVTLAAGEVLTITGTAAAGQDGRVVLLKQ